MEPGSVLVQAPAGSGKTTLLTQRYLRLLAVVDSPERILALTFTRRAAEEMRARVIAALKSGAAPQCPAHANPQTWALAVEARRNLEARRIPAERQPARLRIETIDSFNAWLAAQLPIASGAGGRLRLTEKPRTLYEQAARRALAYEASDGFGAAVERTLALGDQRWRELADLIADLLKSRDRWLPLLAGRLQAASALDEGQLAALRSHFDEDLSILIGRVLEEARATLGGEILASVPPLMRAAAERTRGERPDLAVWEADSSALRPEAGDYERWRSLARTLLTRERQLRRQINRKDGFPAQCAEHGAMRDLLTELAGRPGAVRSLVEISGLPHPRYSDEEWSRVRDVAQVLVLAAAELDGVFRESGAVDFPAVSMAALRALGTDEAPTDLSLRLDYRLQHLLLDEFQDTSSAQLELVRMLTAGWQRGDGRSVFCVGDPMQSIYGFRQAEVRAFLELAEDGIGEVRFDVERLSGNFRSERTLVEWINACFRHVMPSIDDRSRGAIAFRPSVAEARIEPGAEPAVNLRAYPTAACEARAIAELVHARRRHHPDWRIAILVRARAHARAIAQALRTRGVSFQAVDIEPLQDRPAVRDLVMLISALLHPGDRTAWLALLRAPWAGLVLADLLVIARAAPIVWDAIRDERVLERLSAHGRARCRRLRDVLEQAFCLRGHTPLARWVERVWMALGGPGCIGEGPAGLDHVRRAFERLREMESEGLPDAAEMMSRFGDLYADGGASSPVELMTIHKAKGLEFDLVIVPALERASRQSMSPLLLTHEFARAGRDGMVMAARPPAGATPDPVFEFLRAQSKEAAALEAQRLLYVACTRAKRELHLTAVLASSGDAADASADPPAHGADEAAQGPLEAPSGEAPNALGAPRRGSLLAVLWPVAGRQFKIEDSPGARDPATAAQGGGPLRRVPADWSAPPPAAVAHGGAMTPSGPRLETPVFDWAGETARRIGSLVHAELQVLRLATHDEASIRSREPHFRRWLALHGVPSERLREASERVIEALTAVGRDPRGRWILHEGYRDDFRERALSGYWRGELVHVVFDRTFIDEQGIRWVIDYKTSRHTGGGLEEFLAREVERHRPQLERYAVLARKLGPEPVRLGLYFPLMGAWREWAPEN